MKWKLMTSEQDVNRAWDSCLKKNSSKERNFWGPDKTLPKKYPCLAKFNITGYDDRWGIAVEYLYEKDIQPLVDVLAFPVNMSNCVKCGQEFNSQYKDVLCDDCWHSKTKTEKWRLKSGD